MCASCGFPARARPLDGSRRGHARMTGCAPVSAVPQVLQSILPAYGLTAHDGAQVPGIQVATLSGNQTIVRDLEEVWATAERLAGRPVDPLDPRFIGSGTRG